jgi:nucleoid DNA-binding protein
MELKTNSRNNLNKNDISKNIFSNIGISSFYAKKIINDLINVLIVNLQLKKNIKIKNFGSFNLYKKKERTGMNPKNKKKYDISSRNVVTFKTANELKLKVNNNVKE